MDQKVWLYTKIAGMLDDSHKNIIKEYYKNWEISHLINMKHRYVKIFAIDDNRNKPVWIRLDKYVNKRRIYNDSVGKYIRELIDNHIYPIRIFHSVAEWLNPRSVIQGNKNARMIKSGFLVFENDDSLESSLESTKELINLLKGEYYHIFSGNQSIHTWWIDFKPESFLDDTIDLWTRREYYDRVSRYNAYIFYQEKLKLKIDKRVIIDSRRIVPMINTINAITGRIVTIINDLSIKPDELRELTKVNYWKEIII